VYDRHLPSHGEHDHAVVAALNAIVERQVRLGFWKCYQRLPQTGNAWNHKRVYRVYCQMRLNQKRRTKRCLSKRDRQSMVAFASLAPG